MLTLFRGSRLTSKMTKRPWKGLRALSSSEAVDEVQVAVDGYLKQWPGRFRVRINKAIEELQNDPKYNGIIAEEHIDRRTWLVFSGSIRRRLVKSPDTILATNEDFLQFCEYLDAVNESDAEFRFDQLRKTTVEPVAPTQSHNNDARPRRGKNVSRSSVSPEQRRLLDFLFELVLPLARMELDDTISSYKALSTISDLRIPHEWYPYARLMKRKIIYHGGPTNSGKTYHALQRLLQADPEKGGGLYCGPLRLLALEVYESLNRQNVPTDLLTGQERRTSPFASHVACTVEMVTLQREFDVAVIDEIQMISHEQRGHAWTRALHGLRAREIHVCGGLEALNIVRNLVADSGDEFELVEYDRLSTLKISEESLQGDYSRIRPGDCVVAFSRAEIFSIRREIERLTPYKCCVVYGQLPPETRSTQARLFNEDNTGFDVLVASDAIGMGLNLNIGRIVFHTTVKKGRTPKDAGFIDPTTIKQIAGRAGRLSSQYKIGEVTTWQEADLAYVKGVMEYEIPQLTEAGLFPSVEQVENFSDKLRALDPPGKGKGPKLNTKALAKLEASSLPDVDGGPPMPMSQSETTKISALMSRFVELARIDGRYFMCEHDEMVTVANWLHTIPLSLEDRFLFANAPVNTNCTLGMNLLYNFAATYAQGRPVGTNVRIPKQVPKDVKEFTALCAKQNVLDLYLWLGLRFPKYFVARDTCLEQKAHAIHLIEECLHRSTLTQKFSHSLEYQTTRSRLGTNSLPPDEWNDGMIRDRTQTFMAAVDPTKLYCFPHAAEEIALAQAQAQLGRNQSYNAQGLLAKFRPTSDDSNVEMVSDPMEDGNESGHSDNSQTEGKTAKSSMGKKKTNKSKKDSTGANADASKTAFAMQSLDDTDGGASYTDESSRHMRGASWDLLVRIPRAVDIEDLRHHFSRFGRISSLEVVRNGDSGDSEKDAAATDIAFVTFNADVEVHWEDIDSEVHVVGDCPMSVQRVPKVTK